jgi:putative membrane protein
MLPRSDLLNYARGLLMGGADIIPGVSGGTVALILGIYERLVTAISRFDLTLLAHIRRREFLLAVRHIDLRFFIGLGGGIASGIIGLATLMHYLLENQLQYTFSAFFGLILASTFLVGRMVPAWSAVCAALFVAGTVFAYWLVGLPFLTSPPPGNAYVFLCGVIGICAMILPGISGAFMLLVLGKYSDITGLLRNVLHGEATFADVFTIVVFCAGCAIGLISFSKALRWLLARHEPQTMAALCGFMLGSLRKIWPFKQDLSPPGTPFSTREFNNVWPATLDGDVAFTLGIMVLAIAFVLALDWMTKAHAHVPPLEESAA